MRWKTSTFPSTVKSSKNYNKITPLSVSTSHTHALTWEESVHPPRPPPPSRLVLTTLAVWLSHADVISSPTAGAYGNVTGRQWTWWLLTRSSPPTGRTYCAVPPLGGKTGAGQTGSRSRSQMLTHIWIHLHTHTLCHSTRLLYILHIASSPVVESTFTYAYHYHFLPFYYLILLLCNILVVNILVS